MSRSTFHYRSLIGILALGLGAAACLPSGDSSARPERPTQIESGGPNSLPVENASTVPGGSTEVGAATDDSESNGDEAGVSPATTDGPTPLVDKTTTTNSTTTDSTTTAPSTVGSGSVQPVASAAQPALPIRAAFFYPWFPNAWRQGGIEPFTNFTPSLDQYASDDAAIIRQQLQLAETAHIDAMIASWWGPGHHTDDALPALLATTTGAGSPDPDMRWAIYYEEEGQSNPSGSAIASDLQYLAANYFEHPAYLRVDGKPVVFVWAQSSDGAGMADRWANAKERFGGDVYVVMKVFSGFRDVASQPDSWHQYGPAKAYSAHLPYSATVSPGFWLMGEGPRLARDPARFAADVKAMNASGAAWQLITSWNEWGEGTSVEPATEFDKTYIDILADNPPAKTGSPLAFDDSTTTTQAPTTTRPTTTTSPTTAPTPSTIGSASGTTFTFTAGGDLGKRDATTANLRAIGDIAPRFHLALGDISYSETATEAAWCDYAKSLVGSTPIQLIVGNHEDDDRVDGYIGDFADCLPDRMNSTGTYGAEYYFDVDATARVIMIGAANDVGGIKYDYDRGTARYAWLEAAIDSARADGITWVVVGMHKVCITAGNKGCEISPDLMDLLLDKRVDLILSGHDHTYQRTKQLSCATATVYRSECVVDSDDSYSKGAGSVWVVSGLMGGGGLTSIDTSDSEIGYFAEWMGGNSPDAGRGFAKIDVSPQRLTLEFVGTTTSYRDEFTIS